MNSRFYWAASRGPSSYHARRSWHDFEAILQGLQVAADQPPGEKILTHVLTDAINPQYKDRVQPLAQTLLAYCQMKSDAEKRLAYVANTPSLMAGTFNAQKK